MLDLKQVAHDAMTAAQKNLRRHGHLTSAALVIGGKKGHNILVGLQFNSVDEKYAAYHALAQLAHKQHALAVVTVNEAWFSKVKADVDLAGLTHEERRARVEEEMTPSSEDPHRREGIVVAVKAPGASDYALVCPYHREKNRIVLEAVEDYPNVDAFMVPDW